ncbi:TonB-dependent receptor [Sphingobacterium sp. SGG-5]|uniref:TonB-dependent receptor n=1 Tax=Sphingobacterium sp. SGG-5 TaxID=2710881 RepID=UPI0013ED2005|nr:TonB-dependent receptor [Sphingobacterium sp. SGG-5]NGM60877.1 TonB-dependent receptor [Sphingobacterium sp. SGG-5]
MKQFYLLLLLFVCSVCAYGQKTYSIEGKVHKESGEAVSHVTIKIEGTSLVAISDENGLYDFPNVPSGKYTLLISSVEIQSKRLPIHVNKNYPDLHIHIDPKGGLALDEVRIQRNTAKRELETSGFAVAVIETKEASLRNLTTNELLDRAVGVRVRQNGGVGSRVEYNLNGMSGSTVGLFLDGIEVSTYGSSFNLSNIPPAMIERIEVYKGVLPSHLTGDYVGGAINVVLKKDAAHNNITLATSYGSFNTFNSDIGATFRDKKSGLSGRFSGFYTYTDNSYTTWGRSTTHVNHLQQITRGYRAKRFNDVYKSIGGRFEVGFTDVSWADHFFIGYNASHNYNEIPHGITMATPYVGRFTETNADVWSLNYNKRDLFIRGLALNINAVRSSRGTYLQDTVGYAYNWDGTIREVIEFGERVPLKTTLGGQQGEKTMTQIDRDIVNTRSNLGYTVARGHRISLNHKYETTERDDNDLFDPAKKDMTIVSVISKNIFSVNYEGQTWRDKLRFNLMGKFTTNKIDQSKPEIIRVEGQNTLVKRDTTIFTSNFGYGATLSYNLLSNFFVITSMENALIMPNEMQLYGDPEINILPNLDLQPEKNINYNIGFRWTPLELDQHKLAIYSSFFWRNGYDKITQQAVDENQIEEEADADIQTTRYVNLGKTQARGAEAEVTYIYNNRLNVNLNFSKFNNLFKQEIDEVGNPHAFYNQQIPNEPFFTVNLNSQYRFDNVFQKKSIMNLYYNAGYVGKYYVVWGQPEWSPTPTQFAHDVGASYRFPSGKLVASVDVKNIFNAEVYDNFMIQKPGRGIYLKLNYTINKFL